MIAALLLGYAGGAATVLAGFVAYVVFDGRREARHSAERIERVLYPQRPGGVPPLT